MPTPSDAAKALERHLDLRDSLRSARIGRGGREVCQALTGSLDAALSELVGEVPEGMAIVAIGGYGRAELSPYSDVDVMILHSGVDEADMAAALFRPLWDAKLRVGHSVRTLKEAAAAAKERFDTQTTLLTGRLVAGDGRLFERLMEAVAAATRARPLRRHLVSEERARRASNPYLLMATDVKTGRGGLRTVHGFEWERRREQLIGRFSADSKTQVREAEEVLLRVRNALHAVTGRPHDVFSPDLRESVARWLGMGTFECAGELVEAMQTVDLLAARRWPEVLEPEKPGVRRLITSRSPTSHPAGAPELSGLMRMLTSGERGRAVFERLWEDRSLEDVLPEWGVVRSLPQLAPFHEHPVSAHLWRTVDEMQALIAEGGSYARVAEEIDDADVLVLAAFLHDIGKGHGEDHSVVGAEIARSFCARIGVSAHQAHLIEAAVRNHLLLANTATRRDLDDPLVIDETAEQAVSLELLQVLYLLTVADARATGVTMWTPWKATLVRALFHRCAARFGADRPVVIGTSLEEVAASVDPSRKEEAQLHIAAMPDDYLRSVSAPDVLWHMDLIAGLEGGSKVGVRAGKTVETAVVVGSIRPGFRRKVAEAFAANGIDVLEARLFSRADGVVVDSFQVRDDRTGEAIAPGKWVSMRSDLEASLAGELDTSAKMAARAAAYDRDQDMSPRVRGQIDDSSGDLVVRVVCPDRIGTLAEILAALGESALEIRLAKIDSRGGEVIDTFYIPWRGDRHRRPEEAVSRVADALRRRAQSSPMSSFHNWG